jgi:HAD superfamily hydrolase (TIGR01509 family)
VNWWSPATAVRHTGQVGVIEDDNGAAIRALVFDLGGVLLEVDFGRVLGAWAAVAGCDPAVLGRRFTFDEAYQQHERGELDACGYFASLRSSLGLRISDQEFTAGWNDLYLGIAEGMPELLTAASQHYPLYAFTNSNPTHQREWSTRFTSELSVFQSVFVSSDLGLRKPDPAAFATVARRAGLHTREILFFDDSPENTAGARAVGMRAVLVRSVHDVRTTLKELGITPRRPQGRVTTACKAVLENGSPADPRSRHT